MMLFIHAFLWYLAAAVSVCFAVMAFNRKWYIIGIFNVTIIFIDMAFMFLTIANYFAN